MVELLVLVALLAGIVGIVVPAMPGLALMWLATLVYGIIEGFGTGGMIMFSAITLIAVTGEIAGYVLPGKAAGDAGAPKSSIALGIIGAVIGFFVIPVFGLMIGGVLGVMLAEYMRTQNVATAWRSTRATLIGFGVGMLAQLGAGLFIILGWLIWWFFL